MITCLILRGASTVSIGSRWFRLDGGMSLTLPEQVLASRALVIDAMISTAGTRTDGQGYTSGSELAKQVNDAPPNLTTLRAGRSDSQWYLHYHGYEAAVAGTMPAQTLETPGYVARNAAAWRVIVA